jgi:hypothetical protein
MNIRSRTGPPVHHIGRTDLREEARSSGGYASAARATSRSSTAAAASVGFAPGSVFAFVRWASNEHGTIVSRIDILRAIGRGEPYQTVPFVRPGGEILLRIDSWPTGPAGAAAIDAVESLGVDPADVAPGPLAARPQPFDRGSGTAIAYTPERHAAWVSRRRIEP